MADYDVLVIGGGTGGLTAARLTAAAGKRVLLVERDRLGGDCLWTGCVPTKALIEVSRRYHEARHGEQLGIFAPNVSLDFATVREHLARSQDLAGRVDSEAALKAAGVEVAQGDARFVNPHTVSISGRRVWAATIVIAVGSAPYIPDIPGLRESEPDTNVKLLAWDTLPQSLTVIGGGPVGLEFAQALARLGVRVTVLEAAGRILAGEEREASDTIEAVLRGEGVTVRTAANIRRVEHGGEGFSVAFASAGGPEERISSDRLLVATGRRPSLMHLGLDSVGIDYSDRGITVDAQLRTSQRHVFAVGDVTGGYHFTHVAEAQGRLVANIIKAGFSQRLQRWTDRVVPRVTYTDPEVASVGLSEARSQASRRGTRSWRVPLSQVDRAIVMGRTEGYVKLVTAHGWQSRLPGLTRLVGDEIVGAAVVAPHAGELLMPVVNAMKMRLPIGLVAWNMQAYPTLALGVRQAAGLPFS